MQIPNGLRMYLPQTKWTSRPNSSFAGIVEGLLHHLQGNPHVAKQLNWPLDTRFLADKVDEYNAAICQKMGWSAYIMEVSEESGRRRLPSDAPFTSPRSDHSRWGKLFIPLRNVAAGAASVEEMFGAEGPITDKALAEKRAAKCASCDLNERGDWTRFFTVPISRALKSALEIIKHRGMETSRDADLRVCSACSCPCGLKIWARLSHIQKHIPAESKEALAADCWVREEEAS